jgi:Flp pilus assembly protein TadB
MDDDGKVLAERIEQLEKRIYERFDAERELREKMEQSVNGRLEGMNEFRHQLDRQAATFITWPSLFAVSTGVALAVAAVATLIQKLLK